MRIEVVERHAFLTEESCESRQHALNVVLRAAGCSGELPRPHVPTVVIIHHEQQIGLPRPLRRLVHSEVGGSSASPGGGARRPAARRARARETRRAGAQPRTSRLPRVITPIMATRTFCEGIVCI